MGILVNTRGTKGGTEWQDEAAPLRHEYSQPVGGWPWSSALSALMTAARAL